MRVEKRIEDGLEYVEYAIIGDDGDEIVALTYFKGEDKQNPLITFFENVDCFDRQYLVEVRDAINEAIKIFDKEATDEPN